MNQIPHRILGKAGPGLYNVEHTDNCGCQFLISPKYATHVSYDMLHGNIICNHCHVLVTMPTPVYRKRAWSKVGYPDIHAIEKELESFAIRHSTCKMEDIIGPGISHTYNPGVVAPESETPLDRGASEV